jgi:hypothetical protein
MKKALKLIIGILVATELAHVAEWHLQGKLPRGCAVLI